MAGTFTTHQEVAAILVAGGRLEYDPTARHSRYAIYDHHGRRLRYVSAALVQTMVAVGLLDEHRRPTGEAAANEYPKLAEEDRRIVQALDKGGFIVNVAGADGLYPVQDGRRRVLARVDRATIDRLRDAGAITARTWNNRGYWRSARRHPGMQGTSH